MVQESSMDRTLEFKMSVLYCTLSVDLILQELLHCLFFSNVQRCLTFTVHDSYIGTLADKIPVTTAHTNTLVSSQEGIYINKLCRAV